MRRGGGRGGRGGGGRSSGPFNPTLDKAEFRNAKGFDNQVLDMIHPDVAHSGGITGCRKIADYATLTRTPMGMHSGPCSLIRVYASMHIGAATQNFFKMENALGAFRGNKEKMAQVRTR